jgi:hypothetical protein
VRSVKCEEFVAVVCVDMEKRKDIFGVVLQYRNDTILLVSCNVRPASIIYTATVVAERKKSGDGSEHYPFSW